MVKKIFIVLLAVITTIRVSAQTVDEVTLIVSGDGTTKEEARLSALRDAIEQAYGTFVSANTSILDDEVIKDEIVTVSSGTIRKYTELGTIQLPNGNTSITLQATISVSKLITYAQSKGSECEFAGQTFAMNLKLDKLNRENAEKTIDHLIEQLKPLLPDMFEFQLNVEEPLLINDQTVRIGCSIGLDNSPKVKIVFDLLFNTLHAITQHLAQSPRVSGSEPYIHFVIAGNGVTSLTKSYPDQAQFRKEYLLPSTKKLRIFLTREITRALFNWRIRDNLGDTYEVEYNGNYYYQPVNEFRIMYNSLDRETKDKSVGNLITTSSICQVEEGPDIFTLCDLPLICSTNYYYAVVSFPFYDVKTKSIAKTGYNGIYRILLYIPVDQINKFTSFTIEHK